MSSQINLVIHTLTEFTPQCTSNFELVEYYYLGTMFFPN
ncbi:hypothetical protein COO91_02629 [Nostoc flagelliforme CCNUN1]|uniref:Uncharacterized protein n=1 Tax=Nostoc flagelliforme CCNUN1 TaxID=2038116 RepID=A0A2K8SMS8_9NOSO|nr:hypothetical protein COO91_02629 [Nostoc flagelliforme CCNUN1]